MNILYFYSLTGNEAIADSQGMIVKTDTSLDSSVELVEHAQPNQETIECVEVGKGKSTKEDVNLNKSGQIELQGYSKKYVI